MVRAFAELSSCRSIGMTMGPIPWTAIVQWCEWHQLEPAVAEHLIRVVRLVDHDFIRRAATTKQKAKGQ